MKRSLALALLVLTAACADAPAPARYATPRFDHMQPIPVQAAEIQIVRGYVPTGLYPQVEHEFPVRLDDAAEQWLRDRIQLIGDAGTVTFTIEDARVTEVPLHVSKGIKGAFTKDQEARYEARLQVRGMLEQRYPMTRDATTVAEVKIARSIEESPSLRQREELFYDMMQEVMGRFNDTMEQQLRAQMAPFDSIDSYR
jgi:hypothetical protein